MKNSNSGITMPNTKTDLCEIDNGPCDRHHWCETCPLKRLKDELEAKTDDEIYEEYKEKAYEAYKRDWCQCRGYRLKRVEKAYRNNQEYHGEMFVSLGEFEDCEFTDEDYMRALMGREGDLYLSIWAQKNYELFHTEF